MTSSESQCFFHLAVTPKAEEVEGIPVVPTIGPTETKAPLSQGLLSVSKAGSPEPNLSSLVGNTAANVRKKRKVSFAPGPPTSFSHRGQETPSLQDTSKPESIPRRNTRSSSQNRNAAAKNIAESTGEVPPPPTHSPASVPADGGLEKPDLPPSVSREKLSDEESISSCASTVSSTGESSSLKIVEGVSVKRRGRPRTKNLLVKETKTNDEATGTQGALEEDKGAKVVESSDAQRTFKTRIVTKQRKARGKKVLCRVTCNLCLPLPPSRRYQCFVV